MKNQAIFFENLKDFLTKKPVSTEHEFLFLVEVQRYTLCAMLMWANHTQALDFKLIIDTLLILSANHLEDFMFTDYVLDEAEISSIIPSPLNVITALIDHYQNQKANPLLLNSLQTIEKHFIELMQRNSLQNSLRQEFIFFLDKLLDFGLATTEIEESTLILEYYETFRSLISKLFISYAENERLSTLILDMVDKWQACIEANKADYPALDHIGLKLEREEAVVNKQSLLEQQAKDQADQEMKNTNKTLIWNEKKKKIQQDEKNLRMKQKEKLAATKISVLDQVQSELDHKLSLKLASSELKISKKIELNEKKTVFYRRNLQIFKDGSDRKS